VSVALQPPVILVHAITGSVLRDEYPLPPEPVWDPGVFGTEFYERIAVHPESARPSPEAHLYEAVGPSRVTVSHAVRSIYGELVELLRNDLHERGDPPVPAHLFSYDWRQDNRASAARLGDFINEVIERTNLLRDYAGECRSVDLVGHSMGGLVIAACLRAGRHRSAAGASQVRRVVTLGTPFLGAVDSLAKLATGESEIVGRRRHTERDVARLTPAVYQLLPVYERAFVDEAARPLSLYETANWQESVVASIAESIRLHSIRPELREGGPAAEAARRVAALQLLEKRLSACRELHALIDELDPDEVLLEPAGWLPLVGIDEKTRFAASLSLRTDPTTGLTRREWNFLVAEADYEGGGSAASAREFRLRLGDGVVPLRGAVPKWAEAKRERIVCVAERDFGGPLDLEDVVVRKFTSLHVTLPLMNLVQRWVLSFLKGRRWGELWGRPLPDVRPADWRPPVAGAGVVSD
jgi:pimeloyl-ACP methyl ester carboxylesterase